MLCLRCVCLHAVAGNMAAAGLLAQADRTVFMELGAGKGWLAAWLHILDPACKEIILLDKVGNFSNKVRPCCDQGCLKFAVNVMA